MENLDKTLRKLSHKAIQNLKVFDIANNISILLGELNFTNWWKTVSSVDEDELSRITTLSKAIEQDSISDHHDVTHDGYSPFEVSDNIRNIIDFWEIDDSFKRDITELTKLYPDKQLIRILKGDNCRKIKKDLEVPIFKLLFWCQLKHNIKTIQKEAELKKYNITSSDESLYIKKAMLEQFDKQIEKNPSHEQLNSLIEGKNILLDGFNICNDMNTDNVSEDIRMEILDNFCKLQKRALRYTDDLLSYYADYLIMILNTNLIPSMIRVNIVGIISKSIIKKAFQAKYDYFRMKYPYANNYRFYNATKYEVNIILPDNFDMLPKVDSINCLRKYKLTKEDIYRMYIFLTTKKYISPETDIYDFSFALTGKPRNQEKCFTKINWINDKIQTLAVFLGLLKTEDDTTYWSRSTKFFLFNGNEIARKQLSAPFSKFKNNPEVRPNEWQLFNSVINNINSR